MLPLLMELLLYKRCISSFSLGAEPHRVVGLVLGVLGALGCDHRIAAVWSNTLVLLPYVSLNRS